MLYNIGMSRTLSAGNLLLLNSVVFSVSLDIGQTHINPQVSKVTSKDLYFFLCQKWQILCHSLALRVVILKNSSLVTLWWWWWFTPLIPAWCVYMCCICRPPLSLRPEFQDNQDYTENPYFGGGEGGHITKTNLQGFFFFIKKLF